MGVRVWGAELGTRDTLRGARVGDRDTSGPGDGAGDLPPMPQFPHYEGGYSNHIFSPPPFSSCFPLFYFPPFLFFSPDTAVWEPAGPFPSPESGLSAPEPPAPRPPAEGRNHRPPPPSLVTPPLLAGASTAHKLGANWDGRSIPPLPQLAEWGHPKGFWGGSRGFGSHRRRPRGFGSPGRGGGVLGAA